MSRPRTVLQVLPRLVTGGVERGTVEVTAALVKAGWKALVASAGGAMVKEIESVGGTHITLPLASKNPLAIYNNINKLSDIIKVNNVGIMHARSRAPAWSATFAAQQSGCGFVTTFHNAYGGISWLKCRYNSVMGRGDRVIAISDFVAEYARTIHHVPEDILRIIPRGVDIERFDPAKVSAERADNLRHAWNVTNAKPLIMLPGRLTRWKGQAIFIEALAQIPHRNFQAVIVGSGDEDYRHEIQNLISQYQLSDTVRLVDECRDMPAAFRVADIVLSASTRPEGFGRVIVEAQAMGCPVIATDHGGARETILEGETGWLVPPADSSAMAQALTKALVLSAEDRARISTNAIAHVRKNFTTALMTARTLAVYEELLDVR